MFLVFVQIRQAMEFLISIKGIFRDLIQNFNFSIARVDAWYQRAFSVTPPSKSQIRSNRIEIKIGTTQKTTMTISALFVSGHCSRCVHRFY